VRELFLPGIIVFSLIVDSLVRQKEEEEELYVCLYMKGSFPALIEERRVLLGG